MEQSRIVILGAGYTGRWLYQAATARGLRVQATSRTPHRNLSTLPEADRLPFDLSLTATWSGIPSDCAIIWCFPPQPFELVREFAAARGLATQRLVVFGSTSAYVRPPSDGSSGAPLVDETTPLDLLQPRVRAEEYLRTECGAIILRVAGIYGPGRNPLNWIRQRRVGISKRYVNLIHVEDLAAIALELCERGAAGESYSVSDGMPRMWKDICRMAEDHWNVTPVVSERRDDPGKRVSTAKLRRTLASPLIHPDLYQALASLEPPVHRIAVRTAHAAVTTASTEQTFEQEERTARDA